MKQERIMVEVTKTSVVKTIDTRSFKSSILEDVAYPTGN